MNTGKLLLIALVCATVFVPISASASWFAEAESGVVFSGYNDVRVSGRSGTRFSLSEDLRTDPSYFFRLRVGVTIARRHTISALVAPLRLQAHGKVGRDIRFNGVEFPADTRLRATYRFDSYRLTYRYDFYLSDQIEIGAGLTVKVRDAAIGVDGQKFTEKTNTGVVPLINFRFDWRFVPRWDLLLEGDALAAPQGRAEDVLLAFQVRFNDFVSGRFGYRVLEGGTGGREVYNFTLIHYGVVGIVAHF